MKIPAGYRPNKAVILGVDPGGRSGWGLLCEVSPAVVFAGVAKKVIERKQVVDAALKLGRQRKLPVVAVLEDFTPGGWKTFVSILRVGESRGRWLEQLELAEIPTVSVRVNDWRKAIYGGNVTAMKTEAAKTLAQTYVKAEWKLDVIHDAAEALLLARWGTRSDKVATLLE